MSNSNAVVQLDLFAEERSTPREQGTPILNGFYYEANSRKFVSFVLGRRHYETSGYGLPVEWKDKIKRERSI